MSEKEEAQTVGAIPVVSFKEFVKENEELFMNSLKETLGEEVADVIVRKIKLYQHGKPDRLFEWKEDCRRAVV